MSHVRVDVAVERLIVRFGTYGDGLFGKRFLVVSELFQLGDELAVALRADVGQTVHQGGCALGQVRQ